MRIKIKYIYSLFYIFSFIILSACSDNSIDNESLFEYTQHISSSFNISNIIDKITIKNPIGFIFLYGTYDSTNVGYVLDKKVRVKSQTLSQAEFDKIILQHTEILDSLICNVESPSITNYYSCNLNLNVPYNKTIYVNKSNKGIYTSYLESDLFAETELEDCTVDQHIGSLEIRTNSGNITSTINIPKEEFCKCYSNNGNIYVKIPVSTSANIKLKTVSGTITIKNLDVNFSINTNAEVSGSLGNGEGTIYLESSNGRITLEGI